MEEKPAVDPTKLHEFVLRFVQDFGANLHGPTILLGAQLGLYRALGDSSGMTSEQLARATTTSERYVREWLAAQAASGYVSLRPDGATFYLTAEQAFTLADESSPAYLPGAFSIAAALYKDQPRILEAFRTGTGVGWHEHSPELFVGTEKFFRPGYVANLVSQWLPALPGIVEKLERGGKVADVGCGHGASTIVMAKAFPKTRFVGFDSHEGSIVAARAAAKKAGVDGTVEFQVAAAQSYPGREYDLVAFFDCLHDMGDPKGAAAHVRSTLRPDGTWMVVEPMAQSNLAANLNPIGRIFYSASVGICTPASLSQAGGSSLGAQAPDAVLQEIALAAGFSRFRRATETPFNRVFEGRLD
ncbi:MAG: class I SAM-dependent methyltransferase [Thermoplasmata archaeon]|nr:class I SAM-dependent methyltransferase [Thermoplasmata archaeon]